MRKKTVLSYLIWILMGWDRFLFSAQEPLIMRIPAELLPIIVANPDIIKINEIIDKQKAINSFKPSSQNDIKPSQKSSFLQIRNALFPNLNLLITCQYFVNCNNEEFKLKVNKWACHYLQSIIPQGIALFLLSRENRLAINDSLIIPKQFHIDIFWRLCASETPVTPEMIASSLTKVSFFTPKTQSNQNYEKEEKKFHANLNEVVYKSTKQGHSKAYTFLEYMIKALLGLYRRKGSRELSQEASKICFKEQFGNFFTLLNYLCSLDVIDLTMPVMHSDGNVAQMLFETFSAQFENLPLFVQEKIRSSKDVNNNNFLHEDPSIIEVLVESVLYKAVNQV